MICLNCQQETKNPKFCNRSCAAKYTNSHYQKRKLVTKYCKHCGNLIDRKNTFDQRTVCNDCKPNIYDDKTIQDVIYIQHHKSSAFTLIRSRARIVMKNNPKVCEVCAYNKHVEVCHRKSISSYPLDTLISVVNDPTNLIYLCPNCHWEYDNGLLNVSVLSISWQID